MPKKTLHHFRFGLRGDPEQAITLLKDFPLEARNATVKESQRLAVNTILSNIPVGNKLALRNFSNLRKGERGLSKKIFLSTLTHLTNNNLLTRDVKGASKSTIEFSNRIKRYLPPNITHQPDGYIIINIKDEDRIVAKINTEERQKMKKRLKKYHNFIKQYDVRTGISQIDFEKYNQCHTQVYNKEALQEPRATDILPNVVFNDPNLTKGGRMYGTFWIGMKKELRRSITIDGSKTADIDGKGMHVQLLYHLAGVTIPEGDMYIYTDKRRKITKKLMLLMMNTAEEFIPEQGRQRVIRTYRAEYEKMDKELLLEFILELEGYHYKILDWLYKPNWGHLQKTEAWIMMDIMEKAQQEDILVLPVHDGCLCKIEDKERVLQIFKEIGIEAEENKSHLRPPPLNEARQLLDAHYQYKKAS